MGIKNLKVILSQKCALAINERKLDNYRGMTLGIDISIFLYKYLYNNDDHLEGLTRLILRLLKNNITPVFIFDGKPPSEKKRHRRWGGRRMRYAASEKLEIIRTVETSPLPVRRTLAQFGPHGKG